MFGVEVTFQDGKKVIGCLFADRTIYLHEPISDMWLSVADMLAEMGDRIDGFRVIGPVIDVATCKDDIDKDYIRLRDDLKAEMKRLDQRYKDAKGRLEVYDKYEKPVSFLNEPEDATEVITLQDGTEIKRENLPNGNYLYRSDTVLSVEQHQEINNILAQRQVKEAA